ETGEIPTESLPLTIDKASINHLDIIQENDQYLIKTSGQDPYLFLNGLNRNLSEEELVLTFSYTSTADFGLQVFFTPPTTEGRSISSIMVPASTSLKVFSIDLGDKLQELNWGNHGDQLRLDFGNKANVSIEIKGLAIRNRNEEEKRIAQEKEDFKKNDQLMNEQFVSYLKGNFENSISEVKVAGENITITGQLAGAAAGYSLVEILPGGMPFDDSSYVFNTA